MSDRLPGRGIPEGLRKAKRGELHRLPSLRCWILPDGLWGLAPGVLYRVRERAMPSSSHEGRMRW